MEVTVARTPTDSLPAPATNLAFEADFTNISHQMRGRKLGVPTVLSQARGEVVLPTATTLEFDQNIGKWCLKNLTGSKSFDQQLETGIVEVANNNNLGCLRKVITWKYEETAIYKFLLF